MYTFTCLTAAIKSPNAITCSVFNNYNNNFNKSLRTSPEGMLASNHSHVDLRSMQQTHAALTENFLTLPSICIKTD